MFEGWLEFALFGLASFRLTRLIVFDKITAFIRKPFIHEYEETDPDGTTATYVEVKGKGLRAWIGELISCYWCTGIWISAFLYAGWIIWPIGTEFIIAVLAIAGIAALIETINTKLLD
ncbi:DUF1360 domain-containing protein [Bacillus sp. JJ1562]|uniref:DUF1360 domain-containing protein n=1 Tax=Bacillus sp. JJ1562 TaxID=3122960 RepID=UPI003002EB9D